MKRRLAALAAALAAALPPAPAAAQDGSLRLVRCDSAGRSACLAAQATLRPEEARAVARAGDPGGTWNVEAGPATAHGVHGVVVTESRPPLRLLVLVDVSGSMAGAGMQTARSALRAFVHGLPSGSVRVAVAPFASARVEERIRAARFVDVRTAVAQVDSLPVPARDANTGLYSAVRAGLKRLADERAARGDDGRDMLLVVTDGENDVGHKNDDPDLLQGAPGRGEATEAIRRSTAYVFPVGFGTGVKAGELAALGRVRGEWFTVAEDPVALRRALDDIGQWVVTARALLVPVGGAGEARLAAGPVQLRAARAGAAREGAHAGPWTPPLYALPAFQGWPSEGKRVVARPSGWLPRRLGVLAFFAGVLVILWTAVPPLLAAPAAPHPAGARALRVPLAARTPGAAPAAAPRIRLRHPAAEAAAAPDPGGLRRDLREAPPRRPTDVTAEVRRPAARGG